MKNLCAYRVRAYHNSSAPSHFSPSPMRVMSPLLFAMQSRCARQSCTHAGQHAAYIYSRARMKHTAWWRYIVELLLLLLRWRLAASLTQTHAYTIYRCVYTDKFNYIKPPDGTHLSYGIDARSLNRERQLHIIFTAR